MDGMTTSELSGSRLLGWQQVIPIDAVEASRSHLDATAKRVMEGWADDIALDPAGPVRRESDLVWVENWSEGRGEHVPVAAARMVGCDDAPSAVLMRWEWRAAT